MVIQHNIMALNAHRQLGGNNNMVSKNLEKLSSGFKINRAGDDAAGLAISEKMRSQITGLTRAQSNAQDGISLVQTAEGALTEVHSMLNRMVDLSTQSENGTFQASDRQKIQDEVNALTEEIDRISQATNFNGINLLDGSLSSAGKADFSGFTMTESKAVGNVVVSAAFTDPTTTTSTTGDKKAYTVAWRDAQGNNKSTIVEFTYKGDGTAGNGRLVAADGTEYQADDAGGTADRITGNNFSSAVFAELKKDKDLTANFDISRDTTNFLTFTSKTTGADSADVLSLALSAGGSGLTGGAENINGTGAETAEASHQKFDASKLAVLGLNATDEQAKAAIFEIDGKKFALAANNATNADFAKLGADVHVINLQGATYTAADDAGELTAVLERHTGLEIEASQAADVATGIGATDIVIRSDRKLNAGGEDHSLVLQVGDSNDEFNKVRVAVGDMSASGLKVDNIKVTEQGLSGESIAAIRAAVDQVSSARSGLGALQNRLEHTINNLGVTTENMTAAESRIRDVDMAKEMMDFTKNNVLTQAAQAMLAQANQQPQQVLQLLR